MRDLRVSAQQVGRRQRVVCKTAIALACKGSHRFQWMRCFSVEVASMQLLYHYTQHYTSLCAASLLTMHKWVSIIAHIIIIIIIQLWSYYRGECWYKHLFFVSQSKLYVNQISSFTPTSFMQHLAHSAQLILVGYSCLKTLPHLSIVSFAYSGKTKHKHQHYTATSSHAWVLILLFKFGLCVAMLCSICETETRILKFCMFIL